MRKSDKEKLKKEYALLLDHSYYFRVALNLARHRYQELLRTAEDLGLSDKWSDSESLTSIQIQTEKELGGVSTRIPIDWQLEIQKYHFGPMQVASCLLYEILQKYQNLVKDWPVFKDENIDRYCRKNESFIRKNENFIQLLKGLRDSILHERYENLGRQEEFVTTFTQDGSLTLLLDEGQNLFEDLLKRVWYLISNEENSDAKKRR